MGKKGMAIPPLASCFYSVPKTRKALSLRSERQVKASHSNAITWPAPNASRRRASLSLCTSSARLRWVTSIVTPTTRRRRPSFAYEMQLRGSIQRTSPPQQTTRYSRMRLRCCLWRLAPFGVQATYIVGMRARAPGAARYLFSTLGQTMDGRIT